MRFQSKSLFMLGRYRYEAVVGLLLVSATLAVYWQACDYGFVNFDDNVYVVDNPHLEGGLGSQSLLWAFTTFHASNWHPLTWISFLLDYDLHGLDPRGCHRTNILLHAANVLLLFVVLRQVTGMIGPSAFVAALFGLHPLHVESVVWVAERKDVLSTLFGLLSLWAYAWYVARPRWARYLAVLFAYALSLMSKPMLVTLPCLLLVLDYWPLARLGRKATWRLCIWEKIPLLCLAVCSSLLTWRAQQQQHYIQSLDDFPISTRIENALFSYVAYIGKMLWPKSLAVFYPHPGDDLPHWQVGAAALLLIAISALALKMARRQPYLVVGWLWYLGTLVPVIGLVQVGAQGMADRYTYWPMIGLFIMVAWGFADVAASWSCRPLVIALLEGALVTACALGTWLQLQHWRSSLALWQHALEVSQKNWLAHLNLGTALETQGKLRQAAQHYRAVVDIVPNSPIAHLNLGGCLLSQGELAEAIEHLSLAVQAAPDHVGAHNNLALALARQGKKRLAAEQYAAVVALSPDDGRARYSLGVLLYREGKLAEAAKHLEAAVRLLPDAADVHNILAVTLAKQGQRVAAIEHLRAALAIDPKDAEAHSNLGHIYFQEGKLADAVVCYRRCVELRPGAATFHASLALALAEQSQAGAATLEYQKASRLDPHWLETANREAWKLATHPEARFRDGQMALLLAQQTCRATGNGQARFLDTLAAAYAELGRFDEATSAARKALALVNSMEGSGSPDDIQERLKQYERRQPYRDETLASEP